MAVPATTIVPLRSAPVSFGSATQVTTPLPVAAVAPENAIHAAPLNALHVQSPVVVTVIGPLPPPDGAATADGDAAYWHDVPSCDTMCVAPFTATAPVRALAEAWAGTV